MGAAEDGHGLSAIVTDKDDQETRTRVRIVTLASRPHVNVIHGSSHRMSSTIPRCGLSTQGIPKASRSPTPKDYELILKQKLANATVKIKTLTATQHVEKSHSV